MSTIDEQDENNGPVIESEKVSKVKKVKKFVSKNRTPIAVVVAGGVGLGLGMKFGLAKVDYMEEGNKMLARELEANADELAALWDFLDTKKLAAAAVTFAKERGAIT